MILDILSELGSGPPWLFRVWGCLFSKTYRTEIAVLYKKISPIFVAIDIIFSLACFIGEISLFVYLIKILI
ncbi:hypothetical protein NBRC116492_35410 [Aurantivibrio infirmus]